MYVIMCPVHQNSLLSSSMLTVATADDGSIVTFALVVRDTVKDSAPSTTVSPVIDIDTVWGSVEPLLNVSSLLVIAVKSSPAGEMES